MMLFLLIFLLAILVSIYDFRYARIPNWVTLPLIIVGTWLNLPHPEYVFFFLAAFFFAWRVDWMGGGDAKLWSGMILMIPATPVILWAIPFTFFSTALIQLLWRKIRGEVLTGRRAPAAWRVVIYLLVLTGIHAY